MQNNSGTTMLNKVEFEYVITTFHRKTHDKILDFLKTQNLTPSMNKIVDGDSFFSQISVIGTKEQYDVLSDQKFRISLDSLDK